MLKKIAKIFLWAGVVFGILFVAAYIFVRIKYPPEEIKKILISQAEKAINRRVTIDGLWINPVKGFTLDHIAVYDIPAADSIKHDSAQMFTASRLQLRYRLPSLLKKQIQIQEILVDRPEIFITQNNEKIWNFQDLIAVDTTVAPAMSTPAPQDTAPEFSLPFSVRLKKLAVNNVAVHAILFQPPAIFDLKSGGLSMHLDNLSTSLKSIDELKRETKVSLSLFSNEKPWEIKIQTDSSTQSMQLSSVLELNLKTEVNGAEQIIARGEIALTNTMIQSWENETSVPRVQEFPLSRLFGISFHLLANTEQQKLDLDDLTATLGNETIFSLNGSVTNFLEQPNISIEVTKSEIRLKELMDSFATMLPDSIQTELKKIDVAGVASLRGTQFTGNPLSDNLSDGLNYKLNFAIKNLSAAYAEPEAKLKKLNLTTTAHGVFNADGFHGTDVQLNFSVDSLTLNLDTLFYVFEDLDTKLSAHLNSEFFPGSMKSSITIENFFNTRLNLFANFSSLDRLNKYLANIDLSFQKLSLAEVTQSEMEGDIDLDLKVTSESLDSIHVALNFASDILEIPAEQEPIIVYPMDLISDAVIGTDTTFQNFNLKKLNVQVSDFLSALMHGSACLGETQTVELSVDEIKLDHQNALMVVPEQFLIGLESLKITGNTKINSNISIVVDEKIEPTIHAAGKVEMRAGVDFPAQYFSLGSIENQIDFKTDSKSGKINLQAKLDSLIVVGVLDEPLRNIAVKLTGNTPDFETIILDSANLHIPDFNSDVLLSGVVDSLSGKMQTKLNSHLFLNAVEKNIKFPGKITVNGALKQSTEIRLKENVADVSGWMKFENFCLNYDKIARVDSISGSVQFLQKFDIEKGEIIEGKEAQSFMASASSSYYDLLRPYYYREVSNKFSRLNIKKIKAMEYTASDMNIDMLVQNQRIEIPRFSLRLYDGNMSGMISANVHTGEPDNIEWKVKADLSRLNSAKLLPSAKGNEKNSDLNLNLELEGQGVDPASRLDVGGYLYVTKIGPQFTDNVLQSLDPRGIDKSIQDTRTLLNWGYKPRLISFEIKHDNLYPSIHLVKGKLLTKLIPLNLAGGKIELARIPIKFFLSNMAATAN